MNKDFKPQVLVNPVRQPNSPVSSLHSLYISGCINMCCYQLFEFCEHCFFYYYSTYSITTAWSHLFRKYLGENGSFSKTIQDQGPRCVCFTERKNANKYHVTDTLKTTNQMFSCACLLVIVVHIFLRTPQFIILLVLLIL